MRFWLALKVGAGFLFILKWNFTDKNTENLFWKEFFICTCENHCTDVYRKITENVLDSLKNTCKTLPKTEDWNLHWADPQMRYWIMICNVVFQQ